MEGILVNFSEQGHRISPLDRILSCNLCRQEFKYSELQSSGLVWIKGRYCTSCIEVIKRENTYKCRGCFKDFVSPTSSRNPLCSDCLPFDRGKAKKILKRHIQEARKKGLPATLTVEQWLETVRVFAGKCAYCQKHPYEALDHFIPNGHTTVKNCIPDCTSCNRSKGTFDPVKPPLRLLSVRQDIDRDALPGVITELLEGVERVAEYLNIPFPCRYHNEWEQEAIDKLLTSLSKSGSKYYLFHLGKPDVNE